MQEKSQSGMRKLNCKQGRELVCGFVANSLVLIFALTGHNTVNIPEIFPVLTVFPVTLFMVMLDSNSGIIKKGCPNLSKYLRKI